MICLSCKIIWCSFSWVECNVHVLFTSWGNRKSCLSKGLHALALPLPCNGQGVTVWLLDYYSSYFHKQKHMPQSWRLCCLMNSIVLCPHYWYLTQRFSKNSFKGRKQFIVLYCWLSKSLDVKGLTWFFKTPRLKRIFGYRENFLLHRKSFQLSLPTW